MGQQITRRGMMKTCLTAVAAGAVGSVSTTAQAAATAPAANDYDAIILGAGTAGLVAAVEAYDQGIKPVVLEKMDLPAGNSIYAMGGVAACGTRIQKQEGVAESKDDLFETVSYRFITFELARRLSTRCPRASWLIAKSNHRQARRSLQDAYVDQRRLCVIPSLWLPIPFLRWLEWRL